MDTCGPEADDPFSAGPSEGQQWPNTVSQGLCHAPHVNSPCRHWIISHHPKKKGECRTIRYFERERDPIHMTCITGYLNTVCPGISTVCSFSHPLGGPGTVPHRLGGITLIDTFQPFFSIWQCNTSGCSILQHVIYSHIVAKWLTLLNNRGRVSWPSSSIPIPLHVWRAPWKAVVLQGPHLPALLHLAGVWPVLSNWTQKVMCIPSRPRQLGCPFFTFSSYLLLKDSKTQGME